MYEAVNINGSLTVFYPLIMIANSRTRDFSWAPLDAACFKPFE